MGAYTENLTAVDSFPLRLFASRLVEPAPMRVLHPTAEKAAVVSVVASKYPYFGGTQTHTLKPSAVFAGSLSADFKEGVAEFSNLACQTAQMRLSRAFGGYSWYKVSVQLLPSKEVVQTRAFLIGTRRSASNNMMGLRPERDTKIAPSLPGLTKALCDSMHQSGKRTLADLDGCDLRAFVPAKLDIAQVHMGLRTFEVFLKTMQPTVTELEPPGQPEPEPEPAFRSDEEGGSSKRRRLSPSERVAVAFELLFGNEDEAAADRVVDAMRHRRDFLSNTHP